MADYSKYRDTRSSVEKRSDFGGAIASVAVVAGLMAARKKILVTRGISRDILGAGLGTEGRYSRYLSTSAQKTKSAKASSIRERIVQRADKMEEAFHDPIAFLQRSHDLFKPLPSDEESYNIAIQFLNKNLKHPSTMFPSWQHFGMKESSIIRKIFKGPRVVPFAPGTTLGAIGKGIPKSVGKHGALLIDEELHFLRSPMEARRTGEFSHMVPGKFSVGIVNSWGANAERVRRGIIEPVNPKNVEEYIRDIELDPRSVLEAEKRQFLRKEYLARFFPGMSVGQGKTSSEIETLASEELSKRFPETPDWGVARWYNPASGEEEVIPSVWEFMNKEVSQYDASSMESATFGEKLQKEAEETRKIIASEAAKSGFANARFAAFNIGRKLGISEEFASYGGGFPQKVEMWARKGAGWGYKHPSGEMLPITPRRYNVVGKTLGSHWGEEEGPWYITTAKDTAYRNLNVYGAGTLHRVLEHATGLGISSRHNAATEFIKDAVGSKTGSWSDLFIRNIGKTARAMGLGFGAYYAYKAINDIARNTVGWGPNDIAADAYVNAREFQQKVLDATGVTSLASTLENAFPGSISSPASHAIRLMSPYLMANFFGKRYGPRGFASGLAAGIAFALITWGDITQSPEDLHKIFTGENDIPVKKGRYWILGSTPFFGGKTSYWRPHWYPLMKSRYQYKGEGWDSEKEQWAQGTPFSPILAPILTGKPWDPYAFERKHYLDRPYPVTGELFEPTMPFAALGNLTIGNVIKPPVIMHKEYLGMEQRDSSEQERGIPLNIGPQLGFQELSGAGITGGESPYSIKHQAGLAAYSQVEQMGLLGYGVNTLWQKVSGQTNFMDSQSILQSSRRATGYERGYWEKEIGDPGAGVEEGLTEYFRRFLPHRRGNVEEYNPIPNTMPDWLPGEDYFTNFRQGDPYIKVPYGEARLPGGGYESLHQLHSGIPGVYDTVDQFLILADVAPYSNEYKKHRSIAVKMTGGDPYWSSQVKRAIMQRDALAQDYEFIDYSNKNVPLPLRPFSSLYKHILSGITSAPNPLDINPMQVVSGGVPSHINKWISYQTPEEKYKDYQLYGSEYAMWNKPIESFIFPFMRRSRGEIDRDYVPESVQRRREIQEYFDKLKYIKYSNLSALARDQGNADLATKFSKVANNTMAAGRYNEWSAMMSIPKEEKPFFKEFSMAEGDRRENILSLVPKYMRNYYMSEWNKADGEKTYDIDYQSSKDLTGYFKDHYLPSPEWMGWHPDVSLDQVKLKTVKNEGMDIHKFNLWESNERQLSRQPFTPMVEGINASSNDMTMLQNTIAMNMEKLGVADSRVYVTRTPSSENSHRIKIILKRDKGRENDSAMNSAMASISG